MTHLWLLLFLNTWFKSEAQGFGTNLIKVSDDDRGQTICTVALLGKYFHSGESLSGFVLHMSITSAATHVQQSLLQALHTDPNYPWTIVVNEARRDFDSPIMSQFVMHEKPQCYFIVIENMEDEDLDETFENWKSNLNWNPLAQFVVYLSAVEESEEEMTDIMIEILLSFMNKKIYNVNIIGQSEESSYYYGKTVFPYHPDNNCGNRVISIETLDLCEYQESEKEEDEEGEVEEEEEGGEELDGEEEGGAAEEEDVTREEGKGEEGGAVEDGGGLEEEERAEEADGVEDGEEERAVMKEGEKKDCGEVEEGGEVENGEEVKEEEEVKEGAVVEEERVVTKEEEKNELGERVGVKGGLGEEEGIVEEDGVVEEEVVVVEEVIVEEGLKVKEKRVIEEEDVVVEREVVEKGEVVEKSGKVEEEGIMEWEEVANGVDLLEKGDVVEERGIVEGVINGGVGEEIVEEKEGEKEKEEIGEKDEREEEREESEDIDDDRIKKKENKEVKQKTDVNIDSQETFSYSIEHKETFTTIVYTFLQTTSPYEPEYIDQTSTTLTNIPNTSSEIENIEMTSSAVPNITQQLNTPHEIEYIDETSTLEDRLKKSHSTNTLHPTPPTEMEYITSDANDIVGAQDIQMEDTNLTEIKNNNNSIYPKLYIEELYRALFLDKFPKDLSGCPLVAAYRPWEPYIFNEALENVKNFENASDIEKMNNINHNNDTLSNNFEDNYGDGDYIVYSESQNTKSDSDLDVQTHSVEVRLNGIEYKMIQTIAERLHISIEMQVENTNLYHLFQQLIDGDIEMVVGGIDEDPSISQFVSSTVPYHQDDLTWCVAKANHTHNLFNFMTTFQNDSWILTLLFILTASLNILMSHKFLELRLGLLKSYFSINIYVMGSILSQAIHLRPIPTCLKISFGTIFIMGLMFSNIYQSFLVSTLTTPKSSYQISHLKEIYQYRMQIMGSVDNVRHLNKEGETYRYVREQFQMCYNIEECLQRTATDAKLAVAVSRQHSFYNPRIPRDHLYCFDRNENIYVYLVTMLMPKKFHLLHKISPVIQHIIESGHMQKWARDLDRRRKITEEIQRAREETFKSLTMNQVGGSFVLHNSLLVFATCVFLMERMVWWLVVKRKTRLKLAKLCHRNFV